MPSHHRGCALRASWLLGPRLLGRQSERPAGQSLVPASTWHPPLTTRTSLDLAQVCTGDSWVAIVRELSYSLGTSE